MSKPLDPEVEQVLATMPPINRERPEAEVSFRATLTPEQIQALDAIIEGRLNRHRVQMAKKFVVSSRKAVADATAKAQAEHEQQLREALAAISNKSDIDLEQAYADWRAEHFSAANA